MVREEELCEPVSLAHGWVFQCCLGVRPANTLVTAGLIGEFLVEIEAEAVVGSGEEKSVLVVQ